MHSLASSPFLRAGSGEPARLDPHCPVAPLPPKPAQTPAPTLSTLGWEGRLRFARAHSRCARRAKSAEHPIHRFKGARPLRRPVRAKEKAKRRRFVSNPSRAVRHAVSKTAWCSRQGSLASAGTSSTRDGVLQKAWFPAGPPRECGSHYSGSPGRVQELRGRCPYPTGGNRLGDSKGHSRSPFTRNIRRIPATAMRMLRAKARSYCPVASLRLPATQWTTIAPRP